MPQETSKPKFGAEKRIHPRRVLRTQVVFEDESGEGFIYFYSTDVSLGGVFLESDIPLQLGTSVRLSFSLVEGDVRIRTIGKVVRVEKDPNETLPIIGMGVQFQDPTEQAKEQLRHFVEGPHR